MKHIIIVTLLSLYLICCYYWLQITGEQCLGSCFALFMSTLNDIDLFILSAIVSYFFGLFLVVCYIALVGSLEPYNINHRIVILWAITYPMLVLFGIFLYQIKVFDSRADLFYVIIISIILMCLVYCIYENPSVRNRTIFCVVAIAYIVSIVAIVFPNEKKKNWVTPKYSKTLFEVPALGQFITIDAQDNIIEVKFSKDISNDNSTLHFKYRSKSSSDDLDSNCIFVCFYGNKVLFRPTNIEIINNADYEIIDLDTVMYQYEDVEFQIYDKRVVCKQRINNSWEYLYIKKE